MCSALSQQGIGLGLGLIRGLLCFSQHPLGTFRGFGHHARCLGLGVSHLLGGRLVGANQYSCGFLADGFRERHLVDDGVRCTVLSIGHLLTQLLLELARGP